MGRRARQIGRATGPHGPLLAAALLLIAAALMPGAASPAPAQPATQPAPASAPASRPVAPPARGQKPEALLLVEDNAQLLDIGYGALVDYLGQFDPAQAQAVTVDELNRWPRDRRGDPVRMELRFFDATRMPEAEAVGRVAYQIRAYAGTRGNTKAVIVLSPAAPPQMTRNDVFEVFGYFHKIARRGAQEPDGGILNVPVIVAWQINPKGEAPSGPDMATIVAYVAVLGALVAGWLWLRSRAARAVDLRGQREYRPRRFEMTPEDNERTRVDLPPAEGTASPDAPGPASPPSPSSPDPDSPPDP